MFGIVRLIIMLICVVVAFLGISKIKRISKLVKGIICIALVIALNLTLPFVPFENLFVTFDSPKDAYNYSINNSEIQLVVEGTEVDYVIGMEGFTNRNLMIPKTAEGWKIGLATYGDDILNIFQEDVDIIVHQYKKTEEYFVNVYNTNAEQSEVFDSRGSNFCYYLRDNGVEPKNEYLAYVPSIDENYWVSVNGNKIYVFS